MSHTYKHEALGKQEGETFVPSFTATATDDSSVVLNYKGATIGEPLTAEQVPALIRILNAAMRKAQKGTQAKESMLHARAPRGSKSTKK